VHDRSSAIGAASVTARLEISRLAPTRADPCGRRPGGSLWPVPGGYTEKVSHSRSGTAMEGGTEPEPQTRPRQRLRGRATSGATEGASPNLVPRGSQRMRRKKAVGNFPACKPLKYYNTAKYSCAGAAMKTPPAEVRDDRRRGPESRPERLSANAARKMKGNFSCPQTLEISQNREIISGRFTGSR
jgi:hypothetical protein